MFTVGDQVTQARLLSTCITTAADIPGVPFHRVAATVAVDRLHSLLVAQRRLRVLLLLLPSSRMCTLFPRLQRQPDADWKSWCTATTKHMSILHPILSVFNGVEVASLVDRLIDACLEK